jgi:ribonuclease VapC
MVIDTSAVVAILLREPKAPACEASIAAAPHRLLSAVTRVELSCVIEGRKGEAGRQDLDALLAAMAAELVPISPQQADLAIEAFRRFGKGRHPAGLNIGDCFSYALARAAGLPLLFKGNDFVHTNIIPAMAASEQTGG